MDTTVYEGYNTDWSSEQEHRFVHQRNTDFYTRDQMMGGEPSAVGVVMKTSNDRCQCGWLSGFIPCGEGFATFDDLIVHLGRVHDVQGCAARKLVCRWTTNGGCCDKEYRRDAFRRHIGTHLGGLVPCTECGKPFSRKDTMRAHSKKQHGKQ